MPRTVYCIAILLHALWMLTASPALADGVPAVRDGDDQWLPSIALVMGFTTQEHIGSVDSCQFGFAGCVIPFRDGSSKQNPLTNMNVGGSIEFETPVLPISWLRPRIFFGGEIHHVSSQQRNLARESNPSAVLVYPVDDPESNTFPASGILGQGSSTTSDANTDQYGATLGISFPVDAGDWQVSVKPSVRYLRQKYNFAGIVSDAQRPGIIGNQPPTSIVLLQGSDSLEVHAVGPALELEVGATRVESISASIFVSGGAYRVLSDRDVAFSTIGQNNFQTINYQADWTAEIDPWIYRASVGFRVRWLGGRSGWLFTGDGGGSN